jgi:hypothetical protein
MPCGLTSINSMQRTRIRARLKTTTKINPGNLIHIFPQNQTTIKVAVATSDEEAVVEAEVVVAEDKARMAKDAFKAAILVHYLAMQATHGASVGLTDMGMTNRQDVQSATMLVEAVPLIETRTLSNFLLRPTLRVAERVS